MATTKKARPPKAGRKLPEGVLFRRGSYYARVTIVDERTGKRRDVQKVATSCKHAEQIRDELRREFADHGAESYELRRRTFRQFADYYAKTYIIEAQYVDGRKVTGTLRSVRTVRLHHRTVTEYFGNRPIGTIRHGDLVAFRSDRLGAPVHVSRKKDGAEARPPRQRSIASVNRELAHLKRMFRVAQAEGWITRNPFGDSVTSLISIADERKRERILTGEEEERLLAACDGHPSASFMRPLIIAALDTGCRQGELFKLRWSDVEFTAKRVRIHAFNTKTMRERFVPLTERLAAELRTLRGDRIDSDALVFGILDNCTHSWQTIRRRAGLDGLRFHDLRHTFATRIAQSMQLADVGNILGHTQSQTTLRYINSNQSTLDRAAAALEFGLRRKWRPA